MLSLCDEDHAKKSGYNVMHCQHCSMREDEIARFTLVLLTTVRGHVKSSQKKLSKVTHPYVGSLLGHFVHVTLTVHPGCFKKACQQSKMKQVGSTPFCKLMQQ